MIGGWLALEPGETVEWEAHPRYVRAASAVATSFAVAAVAVGAAIVVDSLALAALAVAPIPGLYGHLQVVNTRFVVMDRAVYRKRGVVGIEVRTVELDRVQNTRSTRGVLGTSSVTGPWRWPAAATSGSTTSTPPTTSGGWSSG